MGIAGNLYVVATPIGNLGDITLRGLEVLKDVDLIAAEDSRHSKKLLNHFSIDKPIISLHEHNEQQRVSFLLEKLNQGQSIALISDAGTPLISDPGFIIVRELQQTGIKVITIPGASAIIAALSISGLPTDHFTFAGFLPVKGKARKQALEQLLSASSTTVFYEAPHRILNTVQELSTILDKGREIVIAKELTKLFETVIRGNSADILNWLEQDHNHQKGEFVLMVKGVEQQAVESEQQVRKILNLLLPELPPKKAVAIAANLTNWSKKNLYNLSLEIKIKECL